MCICFNRQLNARGVLAKRNLKMYFLSCSGSVQMACLSLIAKRVAVSQFTSGDMLDTGLDALNQDGDSFEVALAKQ